MRVSVVVCSALLSMGVCFVREWSGVEWSGVLCRVSEVNEKE